MGPCRIFDGTIIPAIYVYYKTCILLSELCQIDHVLCTCTTLKQHLPTISIVGRLISCCAADVMEKSFDLSGLTAPNTSQPFSVAAYYNKHL